MLEDAAELHLINSSFFCLAVYLDIRRVKRLVVYKTINDSQYDIGGYHPPEQPWEQKKI